MTDLGKSLLALPQSEAVEQIRRLDREFRRERMRTNASDGPRTVGGGEAEEALPTDVEDADDSQDDWQDVLLRRLHRLDPTAFEEFVLYLLRLYGLELERVGGSGEEGIDGIGTAPLSDVLSSGTAARIGDDDSVVPWGAAGEDVHHAQALSEGVSPERGRGGSRS